MWSLLDLDAYQRAARLRPVLVAVLPSAVAVGIVMEAALSTLSWVASLVFLLGLPYALGEKAADEGRALQPELWRRWNGSPTLRLLRHRTTTLNPHTLQAVHSSLAKIIGQPTPSAAEEAADEAAADLLYDRCEYRIRAIAREYPGDYPSVYRASVDFGYRRNFYAIRRWAWLSVIAAFCVAGVHLAIQGPSLPGILALSTAVVIGSYVMRATDGWVKGAAEIWAARIIESCEDMARLHRHDGSRSHTLPTSSEG